MRKFTAHYLISDTGVFLKNGIAIMGVDGFIARFIDIQGDLKEVEQLIFYNGILMGGCLFTKTNASQPISTSDNPFHAWVLQSVGETTQFSIQNLVDLGKQLQLQFPRMKIPEIMNEISEILLAEGEFLKEANPGIYLLTGVDLRELHFTPHTRLKKIL